jgi:hypothetical protein
VAQLRAAELCFGLLLFPFSVLPRSNAAHAAVGNTGSFMIRQGPFKYIAFGTYGPSWLKSYHPQLFNVEQDPYAAPCCRRFTVRKKEGLLCGGEGVGVSRARGRERVDSRGPMHPAGQRD